MESWFDDSLVGSLFKPLLEHSKFASLFKFIYEFTDGAYSDGVQELFDINFITIKLQESSKNLWSRVLINFEQIDLDIFVLLVIVEISSKLLSVSVNITEIDKWSWISELHFFEEFLDLLWIIV